MVTIFVMVINKMLHVLVRFVKMDVELLVIEISYR